MSKVADCIYCGGESRSWCVDSTGILECSSCGAVYKNPMPTDAQLEDMYKEYYSESNIDGSTTQMLSSQASTKNHGKFIEKMLKPGMRVLDYGAGTGDLVEALKSSNCTIDGVEFSKEAIKVARDRYDLNFFSSLDDLMEKSYEYDLILCVEVVEHLAEPGQVLKALSQLLKPGGEIYITTPNRNGLQSRLKKCNWKEAIKPFHLVLFNYKYLKKLLVENGYVSVSYLRFSPLTSDSLIKKIIHRVLQLLGVYGGLRVLARRGIEKV